MWDYKDQSLIYDAKEDDRCGSAWASHVNTCLKAGRQCDKPLLEICGITNRSRQGSEGAKCNRIYRMQRRDKPEQVEKALILFVDLRPSR